ncbi:MAG TPA: PEP-CTERM sorting domain-containing protein [Tepidisphaeraceae bacterium]|nr:PEP-CTERM sorting domain-containing protein [Tepidisphaeraceae bacterium]
MHMKKLFTISALSVIALGASVSHAVIAPNLVGSPDPTTGGYLWTYQADAQAGSEVAAGDFFTMYDFSGYDPTNPNASIATPAQWVATASLVTPPPPNTNPPDDAAIYNITFQYTGLTTTGTLGNFTIFSTYGLISPAPGIYAGQDHDDSGQLLQFISTTDTPAVPEPASLGLLSGACVVLCRRRAQR